ncbi:hypothetical protein PFISCL1PPCAC_1075, partial [Pristionchus fissidentatus]
VKKRAGVSQKARYGEHFSLSMSTCSSLMAQVASSSHNSLLSPLNARNIRAFSSSFRPRAIVGCTKVATFVSACCCKISSTSRQAAGSSIAPRNAYSRSLMLNMARRRSSSLSWMIAIISLSVSN